MIQIKGIIFIIIYKVANLQFQIAILFHKYTEAW